eukprot:5678074-Prymnesium_polylepis.1
MAYDAPCGGCGNYARPAVPRLVLTIHSASPSPDAVRTRTPNAAQMIPISPGGRTKPLGARCWCTIYREREETERPKSLNETIENMKPMGHVDIWN